MHFMLGDDDYHDDHDDHDDMLSVSVASWQCFYWKEIKLLKDSFITY